MPAHPEARHALYRSLLAERRVILLLDNARDATQVRPLLAGGPGCLVLITSRDRLSSLVATDGAQPIHLDVLGEREAAELLTRRVGAARAAAEPEAVRQIVQRCARLPLALAVVAARAASRPQFRLADIADGLGGRDDRLDALETADPEIDARTVFSSSYAALHEPAARLFRRLALHPGPDISSATAAALAGTPLRETRRTLDELTEAVLLNERAPGRYSWHDLLRAYAGEVGAQVDAPDERRAARRRLIDHFAHNATVAARIINPHRSRTDPPEAAEPVTIEPMATFEDAMRWIVAEYQVMLGLVPRAAADGLHRPAWHLARELYTYQMRTGRAHDMIAVQQIALRSADELGEPLLRARALHALGEAYATIGEQDQTLTCIADAVTAYREAGFGRGEAGALLTLADLLTTSGRLVEAQGHYEDAIAISRRIGDDYALAAGLNNLALNRIMAGTDRDLARAAELGQEALDLWSVQDDTAGVAHATDVLGRVYRRQGRYAEAIERFRRSAATFAELEATAMLAESYGEMGLAHAADGEPAAAEIAWRKALAALTGQSTPAADDLRVQILGHLSAAGRLR